MTMKSQQSQQSPQAQPVQYSVPIPTVSLTQQPTAKTKITNAEKQRFITQAGKILKYYPNLDPTALTNNKFKSLKNIANEYNRLQQKTGLSRILGKSKREMLKKKLENTIKNEGMKQELLNFQLFKSLLSTKKQRVNLAISEIKRIYGERQIDQRIANYVKKFKNLRNKELEQSGQSGQSNNSFNFEKLKQTLESRFKQKSTNITYKNLQLLKDQMNKLRLLQRKQYQ